MSLIWVLIVCDDSFFREKLGGLIMESPNFGGAEWTDSSPMAVRQAISGGPNLAIVEVDSHRPGGFHVIDRLRQHGIPFMAMSVAGDPVATRRALDAGALDVFERESLFDDDTCRHLPDRILKAFEGGGKAVPGNNTARVIATPGAVPSPVAPSSARQPVGTAAAGVAKTAGTRAPVGPKVLLVNGGVGLQQILSQSTAIREVLSVEGGRAALDKAVRMQPDVVVVNLTPPAGRGLESISLLVDRLGLPVVVLCDEKDNDSFYEAFNRGALEVFARSQVLSKEGAVTFIDKVLTLARMAIRTVPPSSPAPVPAAVPVPALAGKSALKSGIVAIASSTGGPKALVELLKVFPKDFSHPVVIAQHIHPDYVGGLEVWLARTTSFKVKIAAHGDSLLPGSLYIAPATGNMEVRGGGVLVLSAKQADDLYSPSCDRLLLSAAQVYGSNAIGVILTGMGRDGVQGIRAIHEAGGYTLAQDRATSMVFSMPGSAIELKVVSQIGPPERLGQNIIKWVSAR
ncbi:MAG: hypothetical protein HQL78_08835 [Magnetococcales bacterium]|nr:hypothetical protein [Magnetococcales bacterium]